MTQELGLMFGGVLGVLLLGTLAGQGLRLGARGASEAVSNLNARVMAWWIMCATLAAAVLIGPYGAIGLFAIVSFLALREFIALAPTSAGDHRALLWGFFVFTPLQYYLIAIDWYGLFAILIPVYAFFLIPATSALRGDPARFLERTSIVQWALIICVYNISYVPALLLLDIEGFEDKNAQLLLFLVIVVQASDVLQYVFGKLFGRHKIAPVVSPNKTWEGFVGGVACASLLGMALWWATPYDWWQAWAMALTVALMGFAGGLVMSAIKRDRGIKDYGSLLPGHGGVLDRVDSLVFAAPIFFHLTRYFFWS
jgi:phosphatidate cytidylyltransferase